MLTILLATRADIRMADLRSTKFYITFKDLAALTGGFFFSCSSCVTES
jgi:hypothetical protein